MGEDPAAVGQFVPIEALFGVVDDQEAAVDSYEHNCDSGISNTAASLSRLLPPGELSAQHVPRRDRIPVRVGLTLL